MTILFTSLLNYAQEHVGTAFLFVAFLSAGCLTYIGALITEAGDFSPKGLFLHFFPQVVWSRSSKADLIIFFISKVTQKWVAAFSIAITIAGTTLLVRLLTSVLAFETPWHATRIDWVVLGVAFVIAMDFGEYVSHWLQHKIPALWAFHRVHHTATALTPLTSFRFHPIGNAIDGAFIGLCLAVPVAIAEMLYGLSIVDLLAINATANVVASFLVLQALHHTHFQISFGPLDKVLMSPGMHQVHHSVKRRHWGKNYGTRFSLWDWCFGTAMNIPKEPMTYGVGPASEASSRDHSVLWCYIGPFVQCYDMAASAFRDGRSRQPRDGSIAS